MKKQLIISTLALFFAFNFAWSQNQDYKNTVSATAGLNVFQIFGLIDKFDDDSTVVNLKTKGTASYGLTFDRGLTNWFSLGIATSYNRFDFSADEISIEEEDGSTYNGFVDLDLSRINIGIRPLFHYANKGKIDLYSGFRVGVNIWSLNLKADGTLSPEDVSERIRDSGASFAFQIIPIGFRGYVTPNFAIGVETGFGAPHYFAVQGSYRF